MKRSLQIDRDRWQDLYGMVLKTEIKKNKDLYTAFLFSVLLSPRRTRITINVRTG